MMVHAGKWRCMSEPVAKTQRVALRLSLRLEGLGSVELPLMAKVCVTHVSTR